MTARSRWWLLRKLDSILRGSRARNRWWSNRRMLSLRPSWSNTQPAIPSSCVMSEPLSALPPMQRSSTAKSRNRKPRHLYPDPQRPHQFATLFSSSQTPFLILSKHRRARDDADIHPCYLARKHRTDLFDAQMCKDSWDNGRSSQLTHYYDFGER